MSSAHFPSLAGAASGPPARSGAKRLPPTRLLLPVRATQAA